MKIRETEEGYIVEFFPEVEKIGEIEKRGKWRAEIGDLNGALVVTRAFYDKRYTLNEVIEYAEKLGKRLKRLLG